MHEGFFWEVNMKHYLKSYFRERFFQSTLELNVVPLWNLFFNLFLFHTYSFNFPKYESS